MYQFVFLALMYYSFLPRYSEKQPLGSILKRNFTYYDNNELLYGRQIICQTDLSNISIQVNYYNPPNE